MMTSQIWFSNWMSRLVRTPLPIALEGAKWLSDRHTWTSMSFQPIYFAVIGSQWLFCPVITVFSPTCVSTQLLMFGTMRWINWIPSQGLKGVGKLSLTLWLNTKVHLTFALHKISILVRSERRRDSIVCSCHQWCFWNVKHVFLKLRVEIWF